MTASDLYEAREIISCQAGASTHEGRQFIALLGGAAAAWPLAARGQQTNRMVRIGVLMGSLATGPTKASLTAFQKRLEELGWREGSNANIEVRAGGMATRKRCAAGQRNCSRSLPMSSWCSQISHSRQLCRYLEKYRRYLWRSAIRLAAVLLQASRALEATLQALRASSPLWGASGSRS
jgi:hypothetical protein